VVFGLKTKRIMISAEEARRLASTNEQRLEEWMNKIDNRIQEAAGNCKKDCQIKVDSALVVDLTAKLQDHGYKCHSLASMSSMTLIKISW
jgi:hypothetical protein